MLRINETDTRFETTLSPQLGLIDLVDERISRFLSSRGVPVDIFAVRLMLREALLNAVFHGAGPDGRAPQDQPGGGASRSTIHARLELDRGQVVLTVEDPGSGFEWTRRPEPASALDAGGRGLALMQAYADEITFNDAGNRITLRKRYRETARHAAGSVQG